MHIFFSFLLLQTINKWQDHHGGPGLQHPEMFVPEAPGNHLLTQDAVRKESVVKMRLNIPFLFVHIKKRSTS